ncbi:MAG TPA: xanthine dehydrogenase family protein molybdopterin-binding subunit [Solirubrobacteraceae bacterium]|nr:xanthine dehydrogenase family protein molybdopterin-binding subunit [Solirubrobacteraceae bacterium]
MLRVEDEALLRGRGRFLDDLDPVPGAHQAAILRSTHAHARVRRLDVEAARHHPGVTGVLTGAEVQAASRPFPAACDSPIPYYAAAAEVTRFVGEPLAVVVATDRYLAEDALELIEVDYEPLDPVLDPHVATLVTERDFVYGEPDGAFAAAAVTVSGHFRFPAWTGLPMECYAVVADWASGEDRLTAWSNFQGPFTLHSVAAAALQLPGSRLRLITPPHSGGSFGIKSGVFVYVVLLGLASRKLRVPVRWTEDRLEHLAASQAATIRTTDIAGAFAADGELLGVRIDAIDDVGAYVRAPEPATMFRMHSALAGAYRVRNLALRARVVLTNRCPSGLNRGFGGPQHYLPLEGLMALAARRLQIDPLELARRNLVRELPYRTPSGGLYCTGDFAACLDDAERLVRYQDRLRERDRAHAQGRLVGVGLACVVEPSISNMGYVTLVEDEETRARSLPKSGNAEGATLTINPLGGISVQVSTTPQGQGHATVVAQVVADVFGVTPGDVTVVTETDTAQSAWTIASGNYSSRFSGAGVGAVIGAAGAVAEKLRAIAGAQLDADPAEVELRDGQARLRSDPDAAISLRRLAGMAHWNPDGLPTGMDPGLAATVYYSAPEVTPARDNDISASSENGFVVDIAVVEVDRETGRVSVLDYVSVHDAGRLLNPLLAEGQVLGGFAHGFGSAMQERTAYGPGGELLTATLKDYLCPTAADIPDVRTAHRETPSPLTPLGARGLGEGTTMSAPAALHNAVLDALGRDAPVPLPLTPANVWELLR